MSNGLDIALMKDPEGEWSPENGVRHTDIAFGGYEWESFFYNTLGAHETKYIDGEPIESFETRRIHSFRASLEDYPLLARIHDFYDDASFKAEEISALKSELDSVSHLPMDDRVRRFCEGMLEGCSLATTANLGIRMLSS